METKQEDSNPPTTGCTGCAACRVGSTRTPGTCGCPGSSQHGTASARDPRPIPQSWRPQGAPADLACLEVMGRRLAHAFYYRASVMDLPYLPIRAVLAQAVAMTGDCSGANGQSAAELTWAQGLAIVASNLRHGAIIGDYAQATVDRLLADAGLLTNFMSKGLGKPMVADATFDEIDWWVGSALARSRNHGAIPAATTMRLRITSARMYFKVLRRLGFDLKNPTDGMHGPVRQDRKSRPTTDDEILLLRYTVETLHHHRWAAAVALCEATAVSSELSRVFVSDVFLDTHQVLLPGAMRRRARIGYLSDWGVRQLRWRLNYLAEKYPDIDPATLPITYDGEAGKKSAETSGSKLMYRILCAAGLQGEPGVVAGSVAAAFGRRLWDQTQNLLLVARALGRNTLEGAASEIGITIDDLPDDAEDRIRAAVYGAGADAHPQPGDDVSGDAR